MLSTGLTILQLLLRFQLPREGPYGLLWAGFRVHGGEDRGAWQREGYEGLGAGQGIVGGGERLPPRLVEGLAPCLAGSGQLAGRRGTGLPGRDPGLWAAQ